MIQDIAPKKYSPAFRNTKPKPSDIVYAFAGKGKRNHRMLVKKAGDVLVFPTAAEYYAAGAVEENMQFLFSVDEQDFYLLRQFDVVEKGIVLPGYVYDQLALIRGCNPQVLCFAAMTAYHLFEWYQTNQYCGCCGTKTLPFEKERAIRCPACGNLIFPKICPAVIVGVRNGDEIVVSRYADRDYRGVALLAGFCEIGETPEETVAREVMEEVGIRVKNITYYKSQPWGFASNLLLGYYCDVDGDPTLTIDTNELSVAEWAPRSEVVNSPNNELSLTGEMINMFRLGRDR